MIMAFYTACKKSNSSGSYITATVNGVSFNRSNCVFINDTGAFSTLDIFGANYNPAGGNGVNTFLFPMIKMNILDFTGPGTYAITDTYRGNGGGNPFPTTPVASGIYETGDTTGSPALYGTITITATSPEVVGTFSFTGTDSTKVTNGKFTAKAF